MKLAIPARNPNAKDATTMQTNRISTNCISKLHFRFRLRKGQRVNRHFNRSGVLHKPSKFFFGESLNQMEHPKEYAGGGGSS